MKLENARALITGGSEGIGRAIAEALIANGAKAAIMSRSKDKVSVTANEIHALPITGDVGNESDAKRAVETVVKEFGGIDILVNNAGFGHFMHLVDFDLERFESVFRTNVTGAFLMAREAAKHFIAQGHGELINISSTSGLKGGQRSSAYAGSKFALRGMTECWREELRRHNVRVMLVNPSEVMTDFFSKVGGKQQLSEKKLRPQEIADAIIGALQVDARGFVPEFAVFATNPF